MGGPQQLFFYNFYNYIYLTQTALAKKIYLQNSLLACSKHNNVQNVFPPVHSVQYYGTVKMNMRYQGDRSMVF